MSENSDGQSYTVPPVVEALIQVTYADPASDANFRKLTHRLSKKYASTAELETVNAKLDFAAKNATFLASPQRKFTSSDQADVLIATPDALTWSRLAPYDGWGQLFSRVEGELAIDKDVSGYRKVSRLGVRYVNRLDIPALHREIVRYEDYLTINISVPDQWTAIDNYAWRLEKNFGDLTAIIQSAIVEPQVPNTAAFLLDIDIVTRGPLPAKLADICAKLNEMRSLKNQIFEISVSDTARASFNR